MAKKRKSGEARLEEVDRTVYSAFCTAANSLSQLYTHATNHHKLSFQAGERHALEKLYQRMLKQLQEGSRVSEADIVAYLQHELDYGLEEASISPRAPPQQQLLPQQPPCIQVHANPFAPPPTGNVKNMFSSALSSPVRRSIQHFHLEQGSFHHSNSIVYRNGPQSRENDDSSVLNGSLMDMNADNPRHESSSYWR